MDNPRSFWQNRARNIGKRTKDGLTDFRQWSVINATMDVGDSPYISLEREFAARFFDMDGIDDTNLIHQAYHLARWVERNGTVFRSVLEIGGGFGSMCQFMRSQGIDVPYIIVDLEQLLPLQSYHLGKTVGLHNVNLTTTPPDQLADECLLIALWSVAELAERDRRPYTRYLQECPYVLAGLAHHWFGLDNRDWFREYGLDIVSIEHIGGMYYGFKA
jgi:hypothetical protein